jgi:two-component system response regulator LytT
MKVLIIEDEYYAFERLSVLLSSIDFHTDEITHAKSIKEAVLCFQKENYDLAFVDIQLADGLSFNIFEQVKVNCPLIFTTAYDQHAIRAFKLNSIDYLLKPIRKSDLHEALNKFDRIWRINQENTSVLRDAIHAHNYKNRFVIKVGEFIKLVPTDKVSCFYSFAKGTYLQTIESNNYLIDHSLEGLSTQLDPTLFFRVNRKFIVKIDQITKMVAYSNSRLKVLLKTPADEEIIVARERVKEFKKWLGDSSS